MAETLTDLMLLRMSSSITASALRRQGPAQTVWCAQDFLSQPSLISRFATVRNVEEFRQTLDEETENLRNKLPFNEDKQDGRYWGSARKCINIFLFECALNRYLAKQYGLGRMEEWLEVPLDSLVGTELKEDAANLLQLQLPSWGTVKGLSRDTSNQYQAAAQQIADKYQCVRVHLELRYWRRVDGD